VHYRYCVRTDDGTDIGADGSVGSAIPVDEGVVVFLRLLIGEWPSTARKHDGDGQQECSKGMSDDEVVHGERLYDRGCSGRFSETTHGERAAGWVISATPQRVDELTIVVAGCVSFINAVTRDPGDSTRARLHTRAGV
jgi:hypothetical protein